MKYTAVVAALWFGASSCSGQALSGSDDELRRQAEQLQELRERNEPAPDVRLQGEAKAVLDRLPEEAPCRTINAVRITGMDGRWLYGALAGPGRADSPLGRCLGGKGIELLLSRLTNALVEKGYITSRVQVASQGLEGGELVLTVVPGRVGSIRSSSTDAPLPFSRAVVALKPGDLLDLRAIEQTLENLRRTPNADADITISPGESEGQSDVLITYTKRRPLGLALSVNDAGSEATGKWQGNATLSWYNPLGLGDLAYVSLGQALPGQHDQPYGNRSQVLHYSSALGYWLVSATTSGSDHYQTVAGAFQSYLYSGKSGNHELSLSRVVGRGARWKSLVSFSGFARESRNFIDDTEVQVQHRRTGGWVLGLQHTHYAGDALLEADVQYRRGTGAFGSIAAPEEKFGEGSSRMRMVLGSMSVQLPFSVGGTTLNYSGELRMQWNHMPLTPQDRFCIGGRYTVRGFDGQQSLCGERGQLLRSEISSYWGSVQGYMGIDLGRVSGPSVPPNSHIAGTVLGARYATTLLGSGTLHIDAFIGTPLSQNQGLTTADVSAGLSLGIRF